MFILQLVLVQIIVFAILIFILRKLLQGQISRAADRFDKLSQENQKRREELAQKMEEAEKEYQEKMTKLNQEIETLRAQAKQEAVKTLEDSRNRALAEREKLINEAVQTREAMRQEIMAEMEEKAIQHSKDLIGAFFSNELRKIVHETLVKEVLEGLQDANVEHFQIQTEVAQLVVAEPLTPEEKNRVKKILKEKINKEVQFKEEVDPDLIGGLVLRFGTLVIDGSLTNRLREAAAKLKKETARRYQKAT